MNEPSRPDDARGTPRGPDRARCPRCGASLGRLAAGEAADAGAWSCGCCGLVVPAASAAAASR